MISASRTALKGNKQFPSEKPVFSLSKARYALGRTEKTLEIRPTNLFAVLHRKGLKPNSAKESFDDNPAEKPATNSVTRRPSAQ